MKKIELHAKTKYGLDYNSVIDIEALLWNAKENGERGIVFADKNSIIAFPKIEKIYNKLCTSDPSFKNFKIGYGVELASIIENKEIEIVLLVKNQKGLKKLYKIMSLYLSVFKSKIPFDELYKYKDNLLIGLIMNNTSMNLDLSQFDYIEINQNLDLSSIDKNKIIVYSNKPNSFFPGDKQALDILYFQKKIEKSPECKLYLDTEDTLKIVNNKKLVITNTNLIFNKLERIIINDGKFYTTNIEDFEEFANLVKTNFKKKFKNPTLKNKRILDRELNLIKELNYTYYFKILNEITKYCKLNNEYYQLDGYINNSLVAFALDLTEIEPYNLPYELFYSETPSIELRVSPKFYKEKLSPFIKQKFRSKLIKCGYSYKLSNIRVLCTIKRYEQSTGKTLKLHEKDYICNRLNQAVVSKCSKDEEYFIIPENKVVEDFTPYEPDINIEENNKLTHFDYSDLTDNLIRINFLPSDDIDFISRLRNKTKTNIVFCNEKKVYDLFRGTEILNTNFEILDRTSGLLNINIFDTKEFERKLKRIPNLWLEDLINLIQEKENLIILDDLYNSLTKRVLDDLSIFNVINYTKQTVKTIYSKATLINKIKVSYMQMYYKLYFPKEYYKELLTNLNYDYIDEKLFSYSKNELKDKYLCLNKKDKTWMTIEEHQELTLLEVLFEMYERKIIFHLKKRKVVIE